MPEYIVTVLTRKQYTISGKNIGDVEKKIKPHIPQHSKLLSILKKGEICEISHPAWEKQ